MAGIALMTVAISSCDEETTTLGDSLTEGIDKFDVITQDFKVTTRSIQTDSVLATSQYKYLGRIKDPETGSYITCDYMTQFSILENEATAAFPDKSYIVKDDNGEPVATSCQLRIMLNGFQGDSLTAMKLRLQELAKPLANSSLYYTNFDPADSDKDYLRKDADALKVNKMYSVSDLTMSDSLRNVLRSSSYYQYIQIPLNMEYKKDGKTYNNYGTYLMRQYFEHPSYYKNANSFIRNVCPGFYIQTTDGQGVMLEVVFTQLIVSFSYTSNGQQVSTSKSFNSTDEVLQITHITNDKQRIKTLAADQSCTYLKTPAGIFTEVDLPVTDIKESMYQDKSHSNDTIASAKIVFQRMKNTNELSDYLLEEPQNLLMIPRDSLYTFFEHGGLPDNKISFLGTYSSTQKTYTFNNITNLINHMYANRTSGSKNWNKAVLVPVQVTNTSSSTTTTTAVAGVANEMSICSVRLVGGESNTSAPVVSVIYNRNQ